MPNIIYTVKDLTVDIKNLLEGTFRAIEVTGELSNVKYHGSGHLYFTLKDDREGETSEINAIMFRSQVGQKHLGFNSGDKVTVKGDVTVYVQRGGYQIRATSIVMAGRGDLFEQYLKLKDDLESAGFFDAKYKKPIPRYPKVVGVLTSDTGAARRDIEHTIKRRFPLTKIKLYPTLVQGEEAKYSIVQNLVKANQENDVDVIILGRGGGSIEDLWAFNEEIVAKAVFNSVIPIISAVGHETDTTICDFVADLRAPTPTAGAELAVPDQLEIRERLIQANSLLTQYLVRVFNEKEKELDRLKRHKVLDTPDVILDYKYQLLDHLNEKLVLLKPLNLLNRLKTDIENLNNRLRNRFGDLVKQKTYQTDQLTNTLHLVSPKTIMEKGYAIIKKDDKVLSSTKDINKNDDIQIQLNDGHIVSVVKEIYKEES
jgi:exodeoxyribonuclease VII large subunit